MRLKNVMIELAVRCVVGENSFLSFTGLRRLFLGRVAMASTEVFILLPDLTSFQNHNRPNTALQHSCWKINKC